LHGLPLIYIPISVKNRTKVSVSILLVILFTFSAPTTTDATETTQNKTSCRKAVKTVELLQNIFLHSSCNIDGRK